MSDIHRKYEHLILFILSSCLIQDSEGAEPKSLSLATLFGPQQHHHHSPKPDPVTPLASPLEGSSTGNVSRPPVARALTYEDAMGAQSRSVTSKGGSVAVAGCSDRGHGAVMAVQMVGGGGGNAVVGMLPSSAAAHRQPQQHQPQHCPAIQKLMQGQRGVGGVVGVLQTVSESPENRLCDNGVPLEHHHHHHLFHHHQHQSQQQQQHQHHSHHHHHHHHHQQQQQQHLQPDPIKRLFQAQPLPSSSTSLTSAAAHCCPNPSVQQSPHLSSQPITVDSAPCSHLQAQQSQQLYFNLSKPQLETQHSNQSASTIQGAGGTPQYDYGLNKYSQM